MCCLLSFEVFGSTDYHHTIYLYKHKCIRPTSVAQNRFSESNGFDFKMIIQQYHSPFPIFHPTVKSHPYYLFFNCRWYIVIKWKCNTWNCQMQFSYSYNVSLSKSAQKNKRNCKNMVNIVWNKYDKNLFAFHLWDRNEKYSYKKR